MNKEYWHSKSDAVSINNKIQYKHRELTKQKIIIDKNTQIHFFLIYE